MNVVNGLVEMSCSPGEGEVSSTCEGQELLDDDTQDNDLDSFTSPKVKVSSLVSVKGCSVAK